jgi:hypothetical protein
MSRKRSQRLSGSRIEPPFVFVRRYPLSLVGNPTTLLTLLICSDA